MTPTTTAPADPAAKPVRLEAFEPELLGRFLRAGKPVSLVQLNDGLEPAWQVAAAGSLIDLGCLDTKGNAREGRLSQWVLMVTPRGRESLRLKPLPAPKLEASPAAAPKKTWKQKQW